MPIRFLIEKGVVFRELLGDVTFDALVKHWGEIFTNAELPDPFAIITDLRSCNLLINGKDVQRLVETIRPRMKGRRWISAAVVKSPVQFGVTRQFMTHASEFGENAVFYDFDEAVRWVRELIDDGAQIGSPKAPRLTNRLGR